MDEFSLENTFAGDRRMLWVAAEWQRYADDLAEWAMQHIANRRDVWSQYTIRSGEVSVVMLPIKARRKAGAEMVTLNKLRRHFSGRSVSHLIGLHSISDSGTAKWFAIDIDLHNEEEVNSDETAAVNFEAAMQWSSRLKADGLDPIVFDSNGVGGYHIWVLLERSYPLAAVFDYVDSVRSNWEELGLPRRPEVFPPKREVEEDDLPYTLRLPGRHPRRKHYTRVWNFEPLSETEWLEGGEAIEAILAARAARLPKATSKRKKDSPRPARRTAAIRERPRVCVDLDGVLAKYDEWEGADRIGKPLPGALEFAAELDKFADIVVFTSRCSRNTSNGPSTRSDSSRVRLKIVEWLEDNGFPFQDVYVGMGKPVASAFIDDRAVPCRPQDDDAAFDSALENTRAMVHGLKKRRSSPTKDRRPKNPRR